MAGEEIRQDIPWPSFSQKQNKNLSEGHYHALGKGAAPLDTPAILVVGIRAYDPVVASQRARVVGAEHVEGEALHVRGSQ